jgi:hypothetical protein
VRRWIVCAHIDETHYCEQESERKNEDHRPDAAKEASHSVPLPGREPADVTL